ncbi:hypothetical protein [Psychromonas aquatilis]|uniref:Uncharacterized protein n=1 Tax=Psychromonas aquatilis TaxID=2005072 RepID=A0ABU9GRK0_9GAMM
MAAIFAGLLSSTHVYSAPEQGPVHPPAPENSAESAAIQARLGDTGTLMGSIPIPQSVETCGNEPGITRLICLIDLLKSNVSEDLLALMQLDYTNYIK